jgi:FAD:protein FMN transferase
MKTIAYVMAASLLLMSLTGSAKPPKGTLKNARTYLFQYENVLGTSMELKIVAVSEKQAGIAEKAALAEISRLSGILSSYDAKSEFSKWLASSNQEIVISKELFTVLHLFDSWRNKTDGALDASAEAAGKLWKEAAVKGQLPGQEELMHTVEEIKQTHWQLNAADQTATHLTKTPLRLNSFAKSYIIQSAADKAMAAANIQGILVNIGGDMVISGEMDVPVQISDPEADAENDAPIDQVLIHNRAVATSGNYRRGELIQGVWYSHIIDPRTGQPAGDVLSATVVAPSATDAGALATAFNVLKPAESITLAASFPGVDYLIITSNGERIESKGWKALEVPMSPTDPFHPAGRNPSFQEKEWKNELTITLQLSQQPGFAKRPYAAVWIEDKNNDPVKTIALWYNKPRWISDLREWYHKNGSTWAADRPAYQSTTSATRSPGKYTLKWDGRDDKGNQLKPGTYTVYIEVVREHGGYDLLHQEISCKETPQQYHLNGNIEIADATFAYGKK